MEQFATHFLFSVHSFATNQAHVNLLSISLFSWSQSLWVYSLKLNTHDLRFLKIATLSYFKTTYFVYRLQSEQIKWQHHLCHPLRLHPALFKPLTQPSADTIIVSGWLSKLIFSFPFFLFRPTYSFVYLSQSRLEDLTYIQLNVTRWTAVWLALHRDVVLTTVSRKWPLAILRYLL
jgi:hypothetical protein